MVATDSLDGLFALARGTADLAGCHLLDPETGEHNVPFFMLSGTPEQMVARLREFAALGVSHVALDFAETDPDKLVPLIER